MISSKELLVKADISRATLNNYIKQGLLPRPVIRKGGSGLGRARQLGFFPEDVLERIREIQELKREGLSMDTIIERLRGIPAGPDKYRSGAVERKFSPAVGEQRGRLSRNASMTPGESDTPAYLIGPGLDLEWCNSTAVDRLFPDATGEYRSAGDRNVIQLLCSPYVQQKYRNWRELVAAHFRLLRVVIGPASLFGLVEPLEAMGVQLPAGKTLSPDARAGCSVVPVELITNSGQRRSHLLYGVSFREGTYVTWQTTARLTHELNTMARKRAEGIERLFAEKHYCLVSFCVLAVRLKDESRISAELPAEEYFHLLQEIWQATEDVYSDTRSIPGRAGGSGMLLYFVEEAGERYVRNCLNCAIELAEKMAKIDSLWKRKKGWLNTLGLTMGIDADREYLGVVHNRATVEFLALGESVDRAAGLAGFGGPAAIWVTREVIDSLGPGARNLFRFGVHRQAGDQEVFVENSFSRLIDLAEEFPIPPRLAAAHASLAVTEVVGRQPGPVEPQTQ